LAPLTGAYFGHSRNELGIEVSVEVTQSKHAERVILAGA
jgi:hypothetical protein